MPCSSVLKQFPLVAPPWRGARTTDSVAKRPNDPTIAFRLGHALLYGGLAKEEREAVRLFKLAADQGNATISATCASVALAGWAGRARGCRALQARRLPGNANGANQARRDVRGWPRRGLAQDEREAVRLYKLAANQGNALGQNNLGMMYAVGRGGLAKEAVRLFKPSAD
jgi:TPR repeat protein